MYPYIEIYEGEMFFQNNLYWLENQNCIRVEIKSKLKSENVCYHSVQNLLVSSLLFKNTRIKIYRTIILPVVLYGCETWSLTLNEEHRLREFENRVLRNIFGPKRDEVTGEWRRLHNQELYDLYSWTKYSGDQIEKNEMGGACGTCGRQERFMQGFGGETRGKEITWNT
jgi:hypothetical protein